jgi:hypothetical protein
MWVPISAESRAEVVDRVVAVVESEPVLESQVRLEIDLTAFDPTPLPGWTSVEPDPLERVIDATIFRAMAADVALYQPTREQLEARREALRAAVGDPRAWDALLARHSLDEAGLSVVLRRRMVVEKLLLRNLVTSPADLASWRAECRALLDQVRPRVRIRYVAPLEGEAP